MGELTFQTLLTNPSCEVRMETVNLPRSVSSESGCLSVGAGASPVSVGVVTYMLDLPI